MFPVCEPAGLNRTDMPDSDDDSASRFASVDFTVCTAAKVRLPPHGKPGMLPGPGRDAFFP